MNIRLVSSLTPDDEMRLAEGLLLAFTGLLDRFPIAYTLHIEAGDSLVLHHNHAPGDPPLVAPTTGGSLESSGS